MLEMTIYNMQKKTSETGKEYNARVAVFIPGQSGRLSVTDRIPPFYVRDQKRLTGQEWIRLAAKDVAAAKIEALDVQNRLSAIVNGVAIASPSTESETLVSKVSEYLKEIEANHPHRSWLVYRNSLENFFLPNCHKRCVSDVTRGDILEFKNRMRKMKDVSPRSVYNHFLNTSVFFKWAGHTFVSMGIKGGKGKQSDWPSKFERAPEAYEKEELQALFKAADPDERLLFQAFVCSGIRDAEMAHLRYSDINKTYSTWTIQPTTEHALKTEDSMRTVAVPAELTAKIFEKKKALKAEDGDFVFPQKRNTKKPDSHLLRILKRVAERASANGSKMPIRIDDHKFRSTWITANLRDGVAETDMAKWAGHANTQMLKRYTAVAKLQDQAVHERATRVSKVFASMGD